MYHFRDKRQFQSKITTAIYSHLHVVNTITEEVLLGIFNTGGAQETRMMPLPEDPKILTIGAFV